MSALLERLRDTRLLVILRLRDGGDVLSVARQALGAGVSCLEITADTPGVFEALPLLAADFPGALLGVGTVLEVVTVERAARAGARFVVTPAARPLVALAAAELGLEFLPGAFTPSEALDAWEAGCAAVKLFPASSGGPRHFSELRGPLPHVPLVAVGGVSLENAAKFLDAGAVALGVGSGITGAPNGPAAAAREWLALTAPR